MKLIDIKNQLYAGFLLGCIFLLSACGGTEPPDTAECTPEVRISVDTLTPVTATGEPGMDSLLFRVFTSSGEELFFDSFGNQVDSGGGRLRTSPDLPFYSVILPDKDTYLFQAAALSENNAMLAFGEAREYFDDTGEVIIELHSILDTVELIAPTTADEDAQLLLPLKVHPPNRTDLFALTTDYSFPFYNTNLSSDAIIEELIDSIEIIAACSVDSIEINTSVSGIVSVTNLLTDSPWVSTLSSIDGDTSIALICDDDDDGGSSGGISDFNPPSISLTALTDNITEDTLTVVLSGTVIDQETSVASVNIFDNITLLGQASLDTNSEPNLWSFTHITENLIANTIYSFDYIIRATDAAGNEAIVSQGFSVSIPPPPNLDLTCNTVGFTTAFFNGEEKASAIIIDTNAKIFLAGDTLANTVQNIALARFDNDCAPDTSFSLTGLNGKLTLDISGHDDVIYDAILANDDQILIAGEIDNNWGIFKLTEQGFIDNNFASGGIIEAISSGEDILYSLALDSQDRIIGAGTANGDIALYRWNNDGSLDSSFTNTILSITTGFDALYDIVIKNDDGIYGVGEANGDILIISYDNTGQLDTSFNSTGILTLDINGIDALQSIALDSNALLVVGGYTEDDLLLGRYDTTGQLDNNFNQGNLVITDIVGAKEQAFALLVDTNDQIYLAGYTTQDNQEDFLLVRYSIDGEIDNSFAADGFAITEISEQNDIIYDMAFDQLGNIVVTGVANGLFALARYFP